MYALWTNKTILAIAFGHFWKIHSLKKGHKVNGFLLHCRSRPMSWMFSVLKIVYLVWNKCVWCVCFMCTAVDAIALLWNLDAHIYLFRCLCSATLHLLMRALFFSLAVAFNKCTMLNVHLQRIKYKPFSWNYYLLENVGIAYCYWTLWTLVSVWICKW